MAKRLSLFVQFSLIPIMILIGFPCVSVYFETKSFNRIYHTHYTAIDMLYNGSIIKKIEISKHNKNYKLSVAK